MTTDPREDAQRLLERIAPEPWNVVEDTNELLDEYIGRARRKGCNCGTGDPTDPWCAGHEPETRVFHVEGPARVQIDDLGSYDTLETAEFIAAAPRLLRELLAEVASLRAGCEAQAKLYDLLKNEHADTLTRAESAEAEQAALRAERDRLRAALTRIVEFDSAANYERLGKLMVHFTEEQEAYAAVKGIAEEALTPEEGASR